MRCTARAWSAWTSRASPPPCETIPWVDRAGVARSWPRALRVQVVEQKPVARWGEGGLLNTRGEVFVQDAQHIPAELPELVGPAGHRSRDDRALPRRAGAAGAERPAPDRG